MEYSEKLQNLLVKAKKKKLIPSKSKGRYEQSYTQLLEWQNTNNVKDNFSEEVIEKQEGTKREREHKIRHCRYENFSS